MGDNDTIFLSIFNISTDGERVHTYIYIYNIVPTLYEGNKIIIIMSFPTFPFAPRKTIIIWYYNKLNASVLQHSYLGMILNRHEHFFGYGDGRAVRFRQYQRFFFHTIHFEQAGPNFCYFCNDK